MRWYTDIAATGTQSSLPLYVVNSAGGIGCSTLRLEFVGVGAISLGIGRCEIVICVSWGKREEWRSRGEGRGKKRRAEHRDETTRIIRKRQGTMEKKREGETEERFMERLSLRVPIRATIVQVGSEARLRWGKLSAAGKRLRTNDKGADRDNIDENGEERYGFEESWSHDGSSMNIRIHDALEVAAAQMLEIP